MTPALILFMALGQNPTGYCAVYGSVQGKCLDGATENLMASPPPVQVKCETYQHIDSPSAVYPPPCVDDLHVLTQREWVSQAPSVAQVSQAPFVGSGQTATKPLKCGKYQHVEPDYCVQKTLGSGCGKIIPAHCEDTMHVVTEKEWQELMQKLKTLEILTDCIGRKEPCAVSRTENRP